MPRLLSVNVGLPCDIAWRGETVRTAIWKEPVQGRRMVRRPNIDGDGQGDLAGHGGEQRAVFVYQMESYHYWERQLGRNDFVFGQFGENFTVDGLPDEEVCIGDQYRIGSALFEVTQPRVTCYRVGIRMNEPQMPALLVSHRKPGFYLRVLQEGEVAAGDEIVKVADGPERMTVAEIDGMLYLAGHSREQLERALRLPALSPGWKTSFQALLEQVLTGDTAGGNPGLAPASSPPPAWPGFRPLQVSQMERESRSVLSLVLVPADKHPLVAALPGQFVVLRLQPKPDAPPLLRNYSLSDAPGADHYRVSVKQEANGAASTYVHHQVHVGDVLEVSAPRGNFTFRQGLSPVVLLSAGVGRPRYWPCCMPSLPRHRHGKSGGCSEHVTATNTPLRRSHAAASRSCPQPQLHPLQQARPPGSTRSGLRRPWTPQCDGARGDRRAAQGGLLSVWTIRVPARSDQRPGCLGRHHGPCTHRAFRSGCIQHTRRG